MPRVLHLSIARCNRELPRVDEPLEFLMGIHEEGTGIAWQQNVTIDPETEKHLVDATHDLLLWSVNLALTPDKARKRETELGHVADLTSRSAILFGDAASKHRRDLMTMD